jgi:hypothetical protein
MEACMGASLSVKKASNKENRRSNVDRRKFSYTEYIPERRTHKERRKDEKADGNSEKQIDK